MLPLSLDVQTHHVVPAKFLVVIQASPRLVEEVDFAVVRVYKDIRHEPGSHGISFEAADIPSPRDCPVVAVFPDTVPRSNLPLHTPHQPATLLPQDPSSTPPK